jgi:two-component system response regulator HydG
MHSRFIAVSREMREVIDQLDAVAPFDVAVFLSGESGTGKELAAERLHRKSPRARRAFVAVNCAALPEALLESELFGAARGAFTGALEPRDGLLHRADGGTLFLDEVADLPMRAQTSLLRTLQEKEYRRLGESAVRRSDFRLVSASHKDLDAEVAVGKFRADLLFRLRVLQVGLPPLRERAKDIVALARHFAGGGAGKLGLTPCVLSGEAERALVGYAWPGNVRELENEVVQALVGAREGGVIEVEHLSARVRGAGLGSGLRDASREFERRVLERALERNGGNRSRTAVALGLSRQGLYRKLKSLGL